MNYPQPPYPQQPGYPVQPPGYPPQGAYPPAYAPQPSYPVPGYPAQPAAPQAPVLARGTLEDYLNQPTAGGGAAVTKFFGTRPQGSWLQLQITRDLTNADVRQQTDANNVPQTYKDGKPKFVLVLQVTVLQSSDGSHPAVFPEGQASIWLKGVTSDAFKASLAAAGIANPDAALSNGNLGGAVIVMQSAGEKASNRPGFSATKLYTFTYTPNGRETQPSSDVPPTAPATAVPAPAQVAVPPAVQYAPPQPPQGAPPVMQMAPVPPAAPTGFAPPAAPAPAPGLPDMTAQYQAQAAQLAQAAGVQYAPPAPSQMPPPAPPVAGVPAPPVAAPPGVAPAPGQLPLDPEKASLLARLQGQGQ